MKQKKKTEGVVRLIKTLQQALKMDREKFKVPRSVQQAIPIQRIWPDGVFNSIYQERYLTVSVHKRSIDDARTYFARIGTDIVTHLAKLSSTAEGLDAESRLQIFRDFFKGDVPQAFPFDLKQFAKKGTSFKDWMCPDSMEFERDHFKIGDRYGRVLYMQDYASYVKDDMISELCDFSRNLMLSIDILPVPTDEAVRKSRIDCWAWRQTSPTGRDARMPTITSRQSYHTIWNFREKRPRKCSMI